MVRLLLACLMFMFLSGTAFAADRTFVWDPSTTENVTSYTLYYNGPVDGGLVGAIPADINPAGDVLYVLDTTGMNGAYEFFVTASNQDGESGPSNVVTSFLGVPAAVQNLRLD